jgi:NAD(P)-dependent dehydrogenase (short-subunit alcohol dehydrogenase family)
MTAIMITGCSSGIGRATALQLVRHRDFTVYATARRPDSLAELASAGCRTLALDVTDEESMQSAVRAVESTHGAVGVLVNNAGYGEFGTIEETPIAKVRGQFETNVFGLARLTQLVLPAMRAAGRGRIVNVSSMGGRLVFPVGGYYHASKYAVEAITDALRFEAALFGIAVTLVEPGLIRSGFEEVATRTLGGSEVPDGPYGPLTLVARTQTARNYRSWVAAPPEVVARVIERAVTTRRPRPRYVVTAAARLLVHTRRLLGARVFDAYLRRQFRAA